MLVLTEKTSSEVMEAVVRLCPRLSSHETWDNWAKRVGATLSSRQTGEDRVRAIREVRENLSDAELFARPAPKF